MFFVTFWRELNGRAQIVTGIGAALIVLALAAGIAFVLAPRYEVLFSDLAPEDAAVMTAELDRIKMPYRLNDDGTAIFVASEAVHKTRLKLLSKNLPLHGAVGFELFNGGDLGMTDFAQKVNFQRALQGEITRTILSIEGIQSARVILALPEQQLFKKRDSQPKASINLVLKPGQTLSHDQVNGIARLVSAAVPDIALQDVTIVDQHGIALTGAVGTDGDRDGEGAATGALELKKSTETYLARKLNDVLDQTFGRGKAIARVDVTLDSNRVQHTREELLPSTKDAAAGVLVRERSEGDSGGAAPLPPLPGSEPAATAGGARHEREFQVGRDVLQTISMPGAVRRIAIAAIVNDTLDLSQVAHLKEVLAATVGYDAARGDTIAVYPFAQLAPLARVGTTVPAGAVDTEAATQTSAEETNRAIPMTATNLRHAPAARRSSGIDLVRAIPGWMWVAAALAIGAMIVCGLIVPRARRRKAVHVERPLDVAQRALLLSDMQRWLAAEPPRGTPQ